jgi:K+/H+ antiporter YhaU regulatory subunit KhtT
MVFVLFLWGTSTLVQWAAPERTRYILFRGDLRLLLALVIGGLSLPFLQMLIQPVEKLLRQWLTRSEASSPAVPLVLLTVRIGLAVLGSLVVVTAASPLKTPLPTLFIVAILLGAGAWRSRDTLEAMNKSMDSMLARMFQQGDFEQDAKQDLQKLVREKYSWSVKMEEIVLPLTPCAVNRSIGSLRFREMTGCTIAGIYRGNGHIVNPGPQDALEPGDVLLLMGDAAQIGKAAKMINRYCRLPQGAEVLPEEPVL